MKIKVGSLIKIRSIYGFSIGLVTEVKSPLGMGLYYYAKFPQHNGGVSTHVYQKDIIEVIR